MFFLLCVCHRVLSGDPAAPARVLYEADNARISGSASDFDFSPIPIHAVKKDPAGYSVQILFLFILGFLCRKRFRVFKAFFSICILHCKETLMTGAPR